MATSTQRQPPIADLQADAERMRCTEIDCVIPRIHDARLLDGLTPGTSVKDFRA